MFVRAEVFTVAVVRRSAATQGRCDIVTAVNDWNGGNEGPRGGVRDKKTGDNYLQSGVR